MRVAVELDGGGRTSGDDAEPDADAGSPGRRPSHRKPAAWGWRAIELYTSGPLGEEVSQRAIVRQFAQEGRTVSRWWVQGCIRRWSENGDPNKLSRRGSPRRVGEEQRVWMKALLRETPDLYFYEVRKEFRREFGWSISDQMISAALHHSGSQTRQSTVAPARERAANRDPPPAWGAGAGRSGAVWVGRTYRKSPPSLPRRSGPPSAHARQICHLQRHFAVRDRAGRIDRPLSDRRPRLRHANNTMNSTHATH